MINDNAGEKYILNIFTYKNSKFNWNYTSYLGKKNFIYLYW